MADIPQLTLTIPSTCSTPCESRHSFGWNDLSSELDSIASSYEQSPQSRHEKTNTFARPSEMPRRAFLASKSIELLEQEEEGEEKPGPLRLKATSEGTSFVLTPLNATESSMLSNYLSQSSSFKLEVEIQLSGATSDQFVTPVQTVVSDFVTFSQPSSSASERHLDEKDKIELRHIYSTSSSTYRVQISKFSGLSARKKFSRNARTLTDALWICEFALLMIDQYRFVDELIDNGNYRSLLSMGYVSSIDDYVIQLPNRLHELKSKRLLRSEEVVLVTGVMQEIIKAYGTSRSLAPSSMQHSPRSNAQDATTAPSLFKKAKGSLSQIMGGITWSRKKRRRVSKSDRARVDQLNAAATDQSATKAPVCGVSLPLPLSEPPCPLNNSPRAPAMQLLSSHSLVSLPSPSQYGMQPSLPIPRTIISTDPPPALPPHPYLFPSFSNYTHQVTSGRGPTPAPFPPPPTGRDPPRSLPVFQMGPSGPRGLV
jgi:hypothetical protein